MDILCSGGPAGSAEAHILSLPNVTRLNQLRRALRERGWVNSPWFGWTCPQHQPRSGKDAVLEEAVAVVERRMHVLGEGRNPRDPWELD